MLSIVIPVLNEPDMTAECITAIRETTQDCELVIVDNGSDPPFKAPFTGFVDCTVIRNEQNEGFPKAVNQGIRAAKGDVICLLNNDVIVTPGWAEKLTHTLRPADQIDATTFGDEKPRFIDGEGGYSIVGPVTNYAAGLQKVQAASYQSKEELSQAAETWAEHYQDHVQPVNFVIGFCMAFPRALFDEIGPFDESLWPCSGEEVDFCLRARAAGHSVGIVSGCYVHHEGSKTFQEMQDAGQIEYAEVCRKTDRHLAERWGADFWQRQAISSSAEAKGVCLNLGCGYRKLPGFVNIDNRPEVHPDAVWDVVKGGLGFAESSVDVVRADDFLEHVPRESILPLMNEIWRVLKPGGVFESLTPDAENGQGAWQDPHHVSQWVENSWIYVSDPASRALYGTVADFAIESIERRETGNRVFHLHVIARARK